MAAKYKAVRTAIKMARDQTKVLRSAGARRTSAEKRKALEKARNEGLAIKVTGGRLVITVGINILHSACSAAPGLSVELLDNETELLRIKSPLAFAKAIARELDDDTYREDGTTRLHEALDAACNNLLEQGDECLLEPMDEEDDD